MIFALFIIFVFAGILSFAMFGSQPNVATPAGQVYAANMTVFHQAAMLQWSADFTANPATSYTNCLPNSTCTYFMNQQIYPGAPAGQLAANWPEYNSLVPEGSSSGWQSFLVRNIDGISLNNGSRDYILTIFRGFGAATSTTTTGSGAGGISADNVSLGLANTVTERSGLGLLNCTGGAAGSCQFTRFAADSTGADKPLQFNVGIFIGAAPNYAFSAADLAANSTTGLNGKVAMMTQVSGN